MQLDLESMLPWSESKRLSTVYGLRDVRTAAATDGFWTLWRANREALKGAGISVKKDDARGWLVNWWRPIPKDEQEARAEAVTASRAKDSDIQIPAPDGLEYLGYQRAGIAYAMNRQGTLIADEMGLGKTIQAIGVINANPKIDRVCIICPASLKINWRLELHKWLVRPMTCGIADGKTFPDTQIVIINFEIAHKWEKRLSFFWDLLVVDECHFLKSRRARRTKFILGVRPTRKEIDNAVQERVEAQGDKYHALTAAARKDFIKECQAYAREQLSKSPIPARRRLFLTGTPICNAPLEIWPLISVLDAERWKDFFAFARRYANATRTSFGWDMSGAANLEELQVELRASCMIRRMKADVLTELPAKRRQVIELPSDGLACVRAERAASAAMEDSLARLYARVELAKASADASEYRKAVESLNEGIRVNFAEVSKLRHETAIAKVPLMLEAVAQAIEESGKVILFCHHRDVVAEFEKAFPQAVKVVGGMTAEQKNASVVKFQTDPKCSLFIGSITAAGVGLTLTASSHVIFAELDWVPGNVTQAEDRAHRIGQRESVLVQHYVLEGSIDANMARTTLEKQRIIDRALNDMTHAAADITSGATTVELRDIEQEEPSFRPAKAVSATINELERVAGALGAAQIVAIHQALKMLGGMCDGAAKLDGAGFSKIDVAIGHSLAATLILSPRQAALGRKLCLKYARQLPDQIIQIIKPLSA